MCRNRILLLKKMTTKAMEASAGLYTTSVFASLLSSQPDDA